MEEYFTPKSFSHTCVCTNYLFDVILVYNNDSVEFCIKQNLVLMIIGGHGFWYRGGVYTGVCPKKILRPPLAAGIFFPPGCQNFFFCGGFY